MPASIEAVLNAPVPSWVPDPTAPTVARINPARFFIEARKGRALALLPPLRDGDSLSCPRGVEWVRRGQRWVAPGQPRGLAVTDETVAAWWQTRHTEGSRFALVHRLSPAETAWITSGDYTCRFQCWSLHRGAYLHEEHVTGHQLRHIAGQVARTDTASVHLELPSGIVTLHSLVVGDVFFLPMGSASDE